MGPVKQYTGEKTSGPLSLTVYPGADGGFTLYEDDGSSFDYRKGAWMKLRIAWTDADRRLKITLGEGSRMLPPLQRNIQVRVAGSAEIRTVAFDGKPVEIQL